ncbi:MSHA biogenesis protein MshK [Psychromonas sp. psych-6C06]|uniref:MSHA biogenesis protein MshK n=1 Tax=Psychromonas sp. psych-6C06 TaxID=2058089 RepID=UPI000C3261F8|nr:MSHA biogenesis protein MshK [Psychromonas sp. psych-6C06]PKF62962.1 MSHA biogenesis protein MshK [Psychromonas sp. psych-6C06]
MDKIIFLSLLISSNLFAQSALLVDPTAPLNFQAKKVTKAYRAPLPRLQSLVVKSGHPQAIMNNKLYQKGQYVAGYKIIAIDAEKVLLEYQNKSYKLTLYSFNEQFTH